MAKTLKLPRNGAVGFIVWLDLLVSIQFAYVAILSGTAHESAKKKQGKYYRNSADCEQPVRERWHEIANQDRDEADSNQCHRCAKTDPRKKSGIYRTA